MSKLNRIIVKSKTVPHNIGAPREKPLRVRPIKIERPSKILGGLRKVDGPSGKKIDLSELLNGTTGSIISETLKKLQDAFLKKKETPAPVEEKEAEAPAGEATYKEEDDMGDKKFEFDYNQILGLVKMAIQMFGLTDDIQNWLLSMADKAKEIVPDVEGDIVEDVANAMVLAIMKELGIEPK